MSVCDVKEEICRVCKAVISKKEYRDVVFNHIEQGNLRCFFLQEEFQKRQRSLGDRMIYSWGERLYYANQMAQILTYNETLSGSREMCPLKEEDFDNAIIFRSPSEIWHAIGHIGYNLVANSGRTMISEEDLDKLSSLKDSIAYSCIRRYEDV